MMKDIFFSDYNNNDKNRRKVKHDTGKIPLTELERQRQEIINRKRYEEIVRRQQQDRTAERRSDYVYDDYEPQQQHYQANRSEQEYSKKQKKKNGCTSKLFSLFLVAVLLFVGIFGYGYMLSSKTNYVKTPYSSTPYDVMSDLSVYNILLIGTDKESTDGSSRSDSMILLSIDKKNQKLKFTSFMRDMWVSVQGYGDAKLNAAYAYGGAPLLVKTIENTFKVKIDNYATVSFEMFKSTIDALGGIEVDITEAEADFINRTTHAKVNTGKNTLDGDYALIYCRIRKLDSDFNRTLRQRKVMASIFEKAKQKPLSILFSAGGILENITTDVSPFKLTLKAFGSPAYLSYGSDQLRIPLDGEYTDRTINGQAALVVDFIENIKAVQNFIYGKTNME